MQNLHLTARASILERHSGQSRSSGLGNIRLFAAFSGSTKRKYTYGIAQQSLTTSAILR